MLFRGQVRVGLMLKENTFLYNFSYFVRKNTEDRLAIKKAGIRSMKGLVYKRNRTELLGLDVCDLAKC